MTSLQHFAEPRPPHGGLVAEGALNVLGRPDLDPLVVLMREAVQNSWDARQGRGQVTVDIARRTLSGAQQHALRTRLLADLPPGGLFGEPEQGTVELAAALAAPAVEILTITDKGTSGLGGPLRADLPAAPGEPTDFVDLVFNIGQPPDKAMGGGTYGFGKTISFLVSSCRTVLIHTSTKHEGEQQDRLIASSIGNQFSDGQLNFTGRHWWGLRRGDRVEPCTGAAASELAASIGLPRFDDNEFGTTIAILAPDFGPRDGSTAMQFMADAIAWNFWPKMVGATGQPPSMSFTVADNGIPVPVPDPERTSPLTGYVQALQAVRDCETGRRAAADFPTMYIHEVWSLRPKVLLGWMALHAVPYSVSRAPADGDAGSQTAAAFTGASHHIALMRRAELVVQYRPGPELPTSAAQWCGVFRASEETDRAFAAAEPPTHDDWRPTLIEERRKKSYVTVALREIRSNAEKAFQPRPSRTGSDNSMSAAVIADRLGGIVAPGAGSGSSLPTGPSGGGGGATGAARSRKARIEVTRQWLEGTTNDRVLCVDFIVHHPLGSPTTTVEALVGAASAEGTAVEGERPAGAAIPEILSISNGDLTAPGPTVEVPDAGDGLWTVRVSQPAGAATVVDLRVAKGAQEQ